MENFLLNPLARPAIGRYDIFTKIIAASSLLGALSFNPAFADDISDVTNLLRAGQHVEALRQADASLSKRPKDPQLRFLKGVILTEQNKTAEAITVFTKLTEDFPNLPEPYNNLAVLYAADGQFEKARIALDKAIRTNPAYATAYENLGDVHAKLASQAYDRALQLDSKNTGAKSKLTLVRSLVDTDGNNDAKLAATAPAAKVGAAAPAVAAPAAEKKTVNPPAVITAAPDTKPPQVAVAKPDAVKPSPKTEHKPAPDDNAERDAILKAVNAWAKAWSAQDVKAYLAHYSNDFDTPRGMSRKAWIADRELKINGKDRITVKVESPRITVNGNKATVKFHQSYVSDRLKANTRKTLEMTKVGGKWQIKQERIGS